METYGVQDIRSLLEAVESVYDSFAGQPWWRGQGEDWPLAPHVHRLDRTRQYEANIAIKFEKRARTRHADCPARGQLASWLFLMQHYRLPTRLLDWTESALVGLYFAVEQDEHRHEDGVLWALDPFEMNKQCTGSWGIHEPGFGLAERLVQAAFSPGADYEDNVVALLTEELDMRMMVQQSGVTIHGSPTPLEDYENVDRFLQKLTIPAEAKADLLRWVKRLGTRERALFPDLDHLASDLKEDRYGRPGKFRRPGPEA